MFLRLPCEEFASPAKNEHQPFIIYSEVPDNCSANRRKRAYTSKVFADVPLVLVVPTTGCGSHRLNRIFLSTIKGQVDLKSRLSSIHFTLQAVSRHQELIAAFTARVERELVFDTKQEPPCGSRDRTEALLKWTLRRPVLGRFDVAGNYEGSGIPSAPLSASDLENVLWYVNGDVRGPLIHYEKICGRCANRDEACKNFVSTCISAKIFPGTRITQPQKHRFGSITTCMSEVLPGMLIHSITGSAFKEAFSVAVSKVPKDQICHKEYNHELYQS